LEVDGNTEATRLLVKEYQVKSAILQDVMIMALIQLVFINALRVNEYYQDSPVCSVEWMKKHIFKPYGAMSTKCYNGIKLGILTGIIQQLLRHLLLKGLKKMYFIMSPLDCPNMEYLTTTVDSYQNGMKNRVEINSKVINDFLELDWTYKDQKEYNKNFTPDNQLVELFDLGSLRRELLESIDSAYQQYLWPLKYVMGTEDEEYLAVMESY
jgi:hypothetical protein